MKLGRRLLEVLKASSAALGVPLAALLLVLAEHARLALVLVGVSVAVAGYFLRRLAEVRARKSGMRQLRPELSMERRLGRLCTAVGGTLVMVSLAAPLWIAVVIAILGTGFVAVRGIAVVGDSANREQDLEIGNLSPADECQHIEVWARRIAALPGKLPEYVGSRATNVPPSGKIRGARLGALTLAGVAVLANVSVAAALLYKQTHLPPMASEQGKPAGKETTADDLRPETPGDLAPAWSDLTYENECPELPDPLQIGHGLGALFRFEGAFKAGCGTEAKQVPATDAWFSRGVCAGHLRSVAVSGPDGDKAILYGAAASFALNAAWAGELVSAEGTRPGGGDIYVIETLAGSYSFARRPATSASDGADVEKCEDVTGTDRPFAELPPPMVLLWRDMIEQRSAWVWPNPGNAVDNQIAFVAKAQDEGRGECAAEFSCYLEVDGIRRKEEGTAYVALSELQAYMPPSVPYAGTSGSGR